MWDSVLCYVQRQRVARDQELFKIGQFGTDDHTESSASQKKELIPLLIGSKTSKDIKVNKQTNGMFYYFQLFSPYSLGFFLLLMKSPSIYLPDLISLQVVI